MTEPTPTATLDRDPGPERLAHFFAHVGADQAALDALPMAVAIFDAALRLVSANVRYHALVGDVDGASLARFPRTAADFSATIAQVRTTGVMRTTRVDAVQGEARHTIELQLVPVARRSTRGVVVIGTDVTEREELRTHLAESVSQLSAVFDALPEAVRVYDLEGRLVRANAMAERSAPGRIVETLHELWSREVPRTPTHGPLALEQSPVARALRGEPVTGDTYIVQRPDGEATIEVNAVPLRAPNGMVHGALCVERDVSERVRLAEELETQVQMGNQLVAHVQTEGDRLEQMVAARSGELLKQESARARERRLAALGQLAAGVMHDVNNALNPIMLASWLLERHAEDPDQVREYAERIQKAAETGAATAARVGRFIRQEPPNDGRDQRFDLSHAVADAVGIAEPTWTQRGMGSRVLVERTLDPGLVVVGRVGEVREALLNLVQNALDAMPNGGTILVRAHAVKAEAWLDVQDSGIGMSEEVREQAFDPFFSTKGTAGSGLGLSEVYGIMRRHRGTAELVSAPGRGTTVRLRFPLARGSVTPAVTVRPPWRSLRVLLVDDQPEGRRAVREVLVHAGHQVVEVGDLASARAMLGGAPTHPVVDVVIADVFLPDGHGWELVDDVRRASPAIRIGLITGWELAPPPSVSADFILRKPLAAQELLDRIAG